MSRIIVKALPPTLNENELRNHFSEIGDVTDVKLAKTNSGKSRKFAFIGFRDNNTAEKAIKYFDGTYLRTSKIVVEFAKRIGDASLEELKAQRAQASSNSSNLSLVKNETEMETINSSSGSSSSSNNQKSILSKKDKLKADFMETMKGRSQTSVWANDESTDILQENLTVPSEDSEGGTSSSGSSSSDDDGNSSDSESDLDNKNNNTTQKVKENGTALSDMDFLKSKMVGKTELSSSDSSSSGDSSDDDDDDNDDDDNDNKRDPVRVIDKTNNKEYYQNEIDDYNNGEDDDDVDDIEASGRLFIRNLPYTCAEEDVMATFEEYGQVKSVHLPIDELKRVKGFGFVSFMFPEEATRAMEALDGSTFQGRLLHVIHAKSESAQNNNRQLPIASTRGMSEFQQKRELERRKRAQNTDDASMNINHLRSDAVVQSTASEFGVSASTFLDAQNQSGGEVAVRQAMSETHILRKNKEFFESHGVDINLLFGSKGDNNRKKKASRTIVIKNLPHDTDDEELSGMFLRFGALNQFLLPDSKTVALIQFVESTEARAAFNGLSYRRYKHIPLYLEWVSDSIIDKSKASVPEMKLKAKGSSDAAGKSVLDSLINQSSDIEQTCVYLKNLSFNTTEMELRSHLKSLGSPVDRDVRAISLPRNTRGGINQNAGYGFVELIDHAKAKQTIIKLNGSTLAGHVLEAKLSDKKLTSNNNSSYDNKKQETKSSKLLVRNVAFQATEKDIRALFANFGVVKRVRLPSKAGDSHRGFAFVDFTTPSEASAAKEALASTHLYGRHLVIEWAKEEIDGDHELANLRKRTAADAILLNKASSRKSSKKVVFNETSELDF